MGGAGGAGNGDGGGGVESKFSVQPRPKLNKTFNSYDKLRR